MVPSHPHTTPQRSTASQSLQVGDPPTHGLQFEQSISARANPSPIQGIAKAKTSTTRAESGRTSDANLSTLEATKAYRQSSTALTGASLTSEQYLSALTAKRSRDTASSASSADSDSTSGQPLNAHAAIISSGAGAPAISAGAHTISDQHPSARETSSPAHPERQAHVREGGSWVSLSSEDAVRARLQDLGLGSGMPGSSLTQPVFGSPGRGLDSQVSPLPHVFEFNGT